MSFSFSIRVVPGSGKQQLIVDKKGVLKAYLKNKAEQGKANQELIIMIAKRLGIETDFVKIARGLTCRTKTILIKKDVCADYCSEKLGIVYQTQLL